MARRYYFRNIASDLTATNFNNYAYPNLKGTATAQTVSLLASTPQTASFFLPALHPGLAGKTGSFTIQVNVSTGNNNVNLNTKVSRINSAGTIQSSSLATANQSAAIGLKTFTHTAVALGTWASTDRLRVDLNMVPNNMNQSFAFQYNVSGSNALTPFSLRSYTT